MVRKDEILTMTRAAGVVAAVAAVGLATAACGSDDSSASDTTTTGAAASEAAGASGTASDPGATTGEYRNGTYRHRSLHHSRW